MGTKKPPHLPTVELPPLMPALDDVAPLTVTDIPLPQMIVEDLPSVRKEARKRIRRLIDFLDITDPYVANELEDENEHGDGDAEDEPSLGASELVNQERSWSLTDNPTKDDREQQNEDGDELDTLEASDLEISGESDCDSGCCGSHSTVDDEPSLGSLDGRMSQKRWGQSDTYPGWVIDGEDDGLIKGEDDGLIHGEHDLAEVAIDDAGDGNIPIGNANSVFGVVD